MNDCFKTYVRPFPGELERRRLMIEDRALNCWKFGVLVELAPLKVLANALEVGHESVRVGRSDDGERESRSLLND